MAKNDEIQGFKRLSLRTSVESNVTHTLFVKEHSIRVTEANRPHQKTLFMMNIPPFVDENCISQVFQNVGKIESIEINDKPSSISKINSNKNSLFNPPPTSGFKIGYVVFNKPSELKKALMLENALLTCNGKSFLDTGIKKFMNDYNSSIPVIEKMHSEIELALKKYDEETKRDIEKAKNLGEADDEGWVTVTKHSRKPGFERKERVENKIIAKEKIRQQKKELKNFYTFQIRESKMKHIIELRQKFEEDKKKIAILKESRRFKPF